MTASLRSVLTDLREFIREIECPLDEIDDLLCIADDLEQAIQEIEGRRELPEGTQ